MIKNILTSSRLSVKNRAFGLTIGNFDGVHLGHKCVIEKLISACNHLKIEPAALTFYPHPAVFFGKVTKQGFMLNTYVQRCLELKECGVAEVFMQNFSQKLVDLSPERFLQSLTSKLNIKLIVVGEDFVFGKNAAGNVELLKSFLTKSFSDIKLEIVRKVAKKTQDLPYSSSGIRENLRSGNVEAAREILGKNYVISGRVVAGKGVAGKVLGFATANLQPSISTLLPQNGVYKTRTAVAKNAWLHSVTNVGTKPTTDRSNDVFVETHILNFNESIYGRKIYIEFLSKVRNELKFQNLEALKKQIEQDVEVWL